MRKIGRVLLSLFLYYLLFGFCMACLVGGLNYQESKSTLISLSVVLVVFLIRCAIKFFGKDETESGMRKEDKHSVEPIISHTSYFTSGDYSDCVIETDTKGISSIEKYDLMDGKEFEIHCAELLRKNGFERVRTTKDSGDQGVDILAEKYGIKYAIQCKCYSSDLGNKPVQEVFAGKSIYNCHVAAVLTNRYFTSGGLEAAKATGVILWDRRKLQEFIEVANGK